MHSLVSFTAPLSFVLPIDASVATDHTHSAWNEDYEQVVVYLHKSTGYYFDPVSAVRVDMCACVCVCMCVSQKSVQQTRIAELTSDPSASWKKYSFFNVLGL